MQAGPRTYTGAPVRALGEDRVSPGVDRGAPRLTRMSTTVLRVEVGYAILLVSAFVLPHWIGFDAWIPALAVAIGLACLHGLIAGRVPVLAPVLIAYLAVYVIAALHSDRDTFSWVEAGKYLAPPVLALAIAWACTGEPDSRRRIAVLAFVAVAIQLPVVFEQVISTLIDVGRDQAIFWVDTMVGLLGEGAPGTLTQVTLFAAVVLLACAYLEVVPARPAMVVALLFVSVGALSSTRASYAFAPLALGCLAAALWLTVSKSRPKPVLVLAAVLPFLVVPVLVGITQGLYPGANAPIESVEDLARNLESNQATDRGESADPEVALPGRGKQLTIAVDLATGGGVDDAFVGRGIGITRIKEAGLTGTGEVTSQLTREEQQTNATWIPRTLIETGFLGLLAFAGLLAYMVLLFWRNRDLAETRSLDGAMILAVPGIAALTFAGGFFNTILVVQPYATLFWALLGVALAIDAERSSARMR